MTSAKIVVITAGSARHSASALLADEVRAALEAAAEGAIQLQFTSHHLGQYLYDMADYLDGQAPAALASLFEQVRSADALVAVTPVFKASYSGLFKLFWDLVEPQDVRGTPVLLAATGGSQRHQLVIDHAVRPLFNYFSADLCSTGIYALPGTLKDERTAARISRAAGELLGKISAG